MHDPRCVIEAAGCKSRRVLWSKSHWPLTGKALDYSQANHQRLQSKYLAPQPFVVGRESGEGKKSTLAVEVSHPNCDSKVGRSFSYRSLDCGGGRGGLVDGLHTSAGFSEPSCWPMHVDGSLVPARDAAEDSHFSYSTARPVSAAGRLVLTLMVLMSTTLAEGVSAGAAVKEGFGPTVTSEPWSACRELRPQPHDQERVGHCLDLCAVGSTSRRGLGLGARRG